MLGWRGGECLIFLVCAKAFLFVLEFFCWPLDSCFICFEVFCLLHGGHRRREG